MLGNRFYYTLKPYVPRSLRMGVRRILARRQRAAHATDWPINEAAAAAPPGWPGWPEGRNFAFVLTHDVEGPEGLAKVRPLAELEMKLGFRSSFNFIPEGSYAVPAELRAWLLANGFEVGVHDLQHNGKLFQSHGGFMRKAARINHYLQSWGATGFRAGFMMRNLDWLHALDIHYDSSTFDTDPFEPQSDGAGTIFPFWVPSVAALPGRPDYVELPYTLPQDSTLFLLLKESSPEIWLRKLDWIAAHGGMALVNVHPDYVQFQGEAAQASTFPVVYYTSLLKHVRGNFGTDCWQALPREVARYFAALRPRPQRCRPKRVCMITHSFYARDGRVIRYAEALAERGDQVDVLGLRGSNDSPRDVVINGVQVHNIQDRFRKSEQTEFGYLWPLVRFLVASSWWLTRQHSRRKYDLIHVHNIPDFLIFAAWYPKLKGTPVILDIHDIVPEFFANKFGRSQSTLKVKLLKLMERVSASIADHVIIANHLWLEMYSIRTRTQGRCTPLINYVNANLFVPAVSRRNDGKLIVIFPGGLQWHQGVDIAIRAFQNVLVELPNAEFHIYGDGNAKDSLVTLARELGLEQVVRFFEPTSVDKIATIMAQADLGVVPKRADSFGNEAYSTKIMEFMSVGVPAVVSSTKIDRHYFDDSVVRFFPSGDAAALAHEIVSMLRDEAIRRQMVARALAYVDRNSWSGRKQEYLDLVDSLCLKANSLENPRKTVLAG